MPAPTFPTAFSFSVSFIGDGPPIADMSFQEVSGLETELEQDPVVEGGENRFVHQLPKPAKTSNLTLKRGMTDKNSDLVKWCQSSMEGDLSKQIETKDMTIRLFNEKGGAVASWSLTGAYPVRWTVAGFDAMEDTLAIEAIELAYTTMTRNA